MKWIREKLIYIVLIYINFNFILRLIEKSIYIKDFNYGFTSLLFLVGLLIYWLYDYVINSYLLEKRIHKVLFALFIFSIGGTFYLKRTEFVNYIVNQYLVKNIIILNDLIYNQATTHFYQYKIIIILIIPLFIALILWITFRINKKFILIVSLGVVITLWFSDRYTTVKEYLFVYLFISSLTFIIMSYIKRIEKYKKEGVKVSLKFIYILVYGVIVSLIISKLTIMLPQEYKGRDLTSIGNYFENKFASETSETSSANKDRYSLAASGYSSNEKKLGGPISIDYQEVFKVKSVKPYYLKGTAKDFYDGDKWIKTNEIYYKKPINKDMVFENYGKDEMSIKNSLIIYPDEKFKTNTIFVPNYTFNVSGVDQILFYDKTPVVLSGKAVQNPYTVDFSGYSVYGYNAVIDTIEDIRDYSKRILERKLVTSLVYDVPMDYLLQPNYQDENTIINKKSPIEDRFSYRNSEDLKVIKDYGEYFQVPKNISSRTYDLVKDITKDSKSSIEKVLDIKSYLTKNYVYDIRVSMIPEKSEFIDYFLFKEKKGYCTYFNTAMTIMCRIAGVPARYVEGFKTPNKKDNSGLYIVSNADAHAWCEVLLGDSKYSNLWTIVDASPTAAEDSQIKLTELEKNQKSSVSSGKTDISRNRIPQNQTDNIEPSGGEAGSKSTIFSGGQIKTLNIFTAVILFILMRILRVVKRKRKLFKSIGVAPLYNYYLDRLATIRIVKPEYQGDLEFAQTIVNSEIKERMVILVGGAYAEFYGRHSVVSVNNKEYYEFLEEHIKAYGGRVQYLLNKYFGSI